MLFHTCVGDIFEAAFTVLDSMRAAVLSTFVIKGGSSFEVQ
jgi:hypothetical protein